ncbi:hypothetical protein [Candidatus Enterococcus myersii]|uniref:hypothetical protein n=1 Tax=Candidatus Enterococcus myersii TaxID=2815322 RepID=UPI001A8FD003|nr:hypothetical protein [Enterococcus sp. MJM12]
MEVKKIFQFSGSFVGALIFGGIGIQNGDAIFITVGAVFFMVFCYLSLKYPDYHKKK